MKSIVGEIAARISQLTLLVRSRFSPEDTGHRDLNLPLRSTGDIKGKAREVLPQVGLRDYLHFYNREYRKYGMVKELKKTVRLLTREEFAHKRALTLTLRKLADRHGFRENQKILTLLRERNIEEIERELIKAKRELDTNAAKARKR